MNLDHWQPSTKYDLITIVHGLHYIGDKIGLINKAISSLKSDGVFLSNLDLGNIIIKDNPNDKDSILDYFEKNNLKYSKRRKILTCYGKKQVESNFIFLGADDKAGPNYTGQNVVNSYYSIV